MKAPERPWAREVRGADWYEGDCPVCFGGSAHKCRSKWHKRVLSVVTPQPDPALSALSETAKFGELRVCEIRPGIGLKYVKNAAHCWDLEHRIGRGGMQAGSMYPQNHRFLLITSDDRPAGAVVVKRWRRDPHEIEWFWLAPDYRMGRPLADIGPLITEALRIRFPDLKYAPSESVPINP